MDFAKAGLEMPKSMEGRRKIRTPINNCMFYDCLHTFSGARFGRPKRRQLERCDAFDFLTRKSALGDLYSFFSILFHTPQNLREDGKSGSKSLLSTCLAKISEIAVLEDNSSITNDSERKTYSISPVYKELEDFFSSGSSTSGWRPLKEVLRKHAMHIFADRLGTKNLLRIFLLMFSIIRDTAGEGKILFHDPIGYEPSPGKTLDHEDKCFHRWRTIEDFAQLMGQYGFAYQRTAELLDQDR